MKTRTEQKSPSVDYIAGALENRIRAGEYQHGQWLPTERALAEEFHVSRATVRLVLGELAKRNLVMRAAGCRPLVRRNSALSHPASAKRMSLGLWISGDPTDVGGAMTVRGIQNILDPDSYRLVVANHTGDTLEALIASEAQALARFANDRDISGLILWAFGGNANLATFQALREVGIPMVFIDRRPPVEFDADFVCVHNERSAQSVVRHLIAMGHRRIAHVTNSEQASSVRERFEGYRRALAACHLPFDPELVLTATFMEHETMNRSAAALVERLLTLPDPPTALFAVNDYTAQFMIAALQARGKRVPEDMAVAGFDDEERWKPGEPFLTTVSQPFEAMGEEAARLLLQRIEEGATSVYHHVLLDAPLVVRDSTRQLRS